jgi:hypothetical protein
MFTFTAELALAPIAGCSVPPVAPVLMIPFIFAWADNVVVVVVIAKLVGVPEPDACAKNAAAAVVPVTD